MDSFAMMRSAKAGSVIDYILCSVSQGEDMMLTIDFHTQRGTILLV
jgi:hypothetical protein